LLPKRSAQVSGEIAFLGQDLTRLPEPALRGFRGGIITMVFQDPMTCLNPVLTVGYQIAETVRIHLRRNRAQARTSAAELLRLVGIPEPERRLDNFPHQFSGGMRQRVVIVMALACKPALLIADEPTTALDVTIQARILELIKDLHRRFGMSLIWISHDLGLVAGLADRLLVMYAGFLVEEASVDDLFARPRHPYTIALLQAIPRIRETALTKLERIQGMPPDLTQLPPGCSFAPRCPHVMDVCRTERPPLFELGAGHQAACWLEVGVGRPRPAERRGLDGTIK